MTSIHFTFENNGSLDVQWPQVPRVGETVALDPDDNEIYKVGAVTWLADGGVTIALLNM